MNIEDMANTFIEDMRRMVIEDPTVLEYIEHIWEEVQLAAVRKCGLSIRHIRYPSKKVQLEALRKDEHAFVLIKNPCEEAKEIIIMQNRGMIQELLDKYPVKQEYPAQKEKDEKKEDHDHGWTSQEMEEDDEDEEWEYDKEDDEDDER